MSENAPAPRSGFLTKRKTGQSRIDSPNRNPNRCQSTYARGLQLGTPRLMARAVTFHLVTSTLPSTLRQKAPRSDAPELSPMKHTSRIQTRVCRLGVPLKAANSISDVGEVDAGGHQQSCILVATSPTTPKVDTVDKGAGRPSSNCLCRHASMDAKAF